MEFGVWGSLMILCLCLCEWLSLCFVLSSCSELLKLRMELCVEQVCRLQSGAWTLQKLSSLLLFASLSVLSLSSSVWLSLPGFDFLPHYQPLSVVFSSLSPSFSLPSLLFILLHQTVRAPCYGGFVAGHYWHAWIAALLWFHLVALHHPNVLRVRAVLPQWNGNAERMLHQRCGQDYLKNLLANSRFYHLCSFCTPYWRFVKYSDKEFEWSHICLEYLFALSAELSDIAFSSVLS